MDFISVYTWCRRLVDVAQTPTLKIFDIPGPTNTLVCIDIVSEFAMWLSPTCFAVLAKYAGHVRQTSADVKQSAPTLPDILSSRFQCRENVQQERKEFPGHQLRKMSDRGSKCPAEH